MRSTHSFPVARTRRVVAHRPSAVFVVRLLDLVALHDARITDATVQRVLELLRFGFEELGRELSAMRGGLHLIHPVELLERIAGASQFRGSLLLISITLRMDETTPRLIERRLQCLMASTHAVDRCLHVTQHRIGMHRMHLCGSVGSRVLVCQVFCGDAEVASGAALLSSRERVQRVQWSAYAAAA